MIFLQEIPVEQQPSNPSVQLSVEQQISLSLLVYKISTSYWTFLLFMTQSRRLPSKSLSILQNRVCFSQVLTVPTGCCSHGHKSI